MGLDGKLLELKWAVDAWWLLDSVHALQEASDKQVSFINSMLSQLPADKAAALKQQIVKDYKLDLMSLSWDEALLATNWKKASEIIDMLKAHAPPSAKALAFLWSLITKKNPEHVKSIWNSMTKGHALPAYPPMESDLSHLSSAMVSNLIDGLKVLPYYKAPEPTAAIVPPKITTKQYHEISDLEFELIATYDWDGTKVDTLKKSLNLATSTLVKNYTQEMAAAYLAGLQQAVKIEKSVATKLGGAPTPSAPAPAPPVAGAYLYGHQQKHLFQLIKLKGGAENDKVVKLVNQAAKDAGVPSFLHASDSMGIPDELGQDGYKKLAGELKKLKIKNATNNQVGQVLALLSQLGLANWNKSKLSQKWDKSILRAKELRKLTSPKIQTFIADLKKELKAA